MYHLHMKILSMNYGHSAVAASAYRSRCRLLDWQTGIVHNYTHKHDLYQSFILCPPHTPELLFDREVLWNTIQKTESRKNSQIGREIEMSIPKVFSKDLAVSVVSEFSKTMLVSRGLVVDVAFHGMESKNPHAHLLFTTRPVLDNGHFGSKDRDLYKRDFLVGCRKAWEECCNTSLDMLGLSHLHISCESYSSRGIEKPPQLHMGGRDHRLWKENGEITEKNAQYVVDELTVEIINLEKMRRVSKRVEKRASVRREFLRNACLGMFQTSAIPDSSKSHTAYIQSDAVVVQEPAGYSSAQEKNFSSVEVDLKGSIRGNKDFVNRLAKLENDFDPKRPNNNGPSMG